ncbi:MAG: hypothetical protein BroJett039_13690 [Chloroflexota bacterium]|nr:MAG: hypothetical protein BroJett039_13690 [Chloroflexota bacterium]
MKRLRYLVLILCALTSGFAAAACNAPKTANIENANPIPPLGTPARATLESESTQTPRAATSMPTRQTASVTPTRRAKTATATRPTTLNGFKTIARADLPPEALETLKLIQRGGPFPYRQDGQVFQNREGILPKQKSGYYHEYTVETPGSKDRGARRIVTGAAREFYYTDDHYNSFRILLDP